MAPFSVIFNGNGSSGSITGYSWDFGDGGTANGVSATHLFQKAAGTYTATLTVTAADGTTYDDTVVITGSEPPPPPVASMAENAAGHWMRFQLDENNHKVNPNSYSWSFADGAEGSGQSASHTYQAPGPKDTASLTLAGAGTTSIDTVTIEVSAQPVPPEAIISSTSALGDAPLAVTFDGTESTATQMPLSYHWDFGDGTTASVPTASDNYNNPGDFTAILTVTDSAGLTDTASTPVMVKAPPDEENQPPVSLFTLSSSSGVAPLLVGFDGTVFR